MRSVDGSAKANIAPARCAQVLGVIYELADADWHALDRAESGYHRLRVTLSTASGPVEAVSYIARSERITRQQRPYRWYQQLILAGVQEHNLSVAWRLRLQKQRVKHDPLSRRASKIRILLARNRLKHVARRQNHGSTSDLGRR